MKAIAFTVADDNNLAWAVKMANSWKRFNPDVPMEIIDSKRLAQVADPEVFYRATPLFGRLYLEQGYDTVIKVDADSVILSNLNYLFEDDYDLGVVLNWNRVDPQKYSFPLTVWDISNTHYYNCGFVVMKSKKFVDHWWKLCNRPNFVNYRFREQDLMNIMCHYGDYDVRCFDHSNKWHGLISTGEWGNLELRDNKVILPVVDGYPNEEKEINVIHYAGGNVTTKMNFYRDFPRDVAKYLQEITNA